MVALSVAIDVSPLLGNKSGVGVFVDAAANELARIPDLDLIGFALSLRGASRLRALLPAGFRICKWPVPANPALWLWSRGNVPAVEVWAGRVDVVHGTNFAVPPARRAAEVVTVHDLTCVRFPQMCSRTSRRYPTLIRRAIERGAFVHTPSEFVANEVIEVFGIHSDRVVAIPHGVPQLVKNSQSTAEDGRAFAGAVKYVLALGTVEPRKDLPTLVRAFDFLASEDPELRLVIAGQEAWGSDGLSEAISGCENATRIRRLGYVNDSQRAALLRGATVFAFPSIYEGFGLPPLEAMSVGVPVVATEAGALPEILQDGAALVPVGNPEMLAKAIGQMIEDGDHRQLTIDRGFARVASFRWSRCAAQLAVLYKRAKAEQ